VMLRKIEWLHWSQDSSTISLLKHKFTRPQRWAEKMSEICKLLGCVVFDSENLLHFVLIKRPSSPYLGLPYLPLLCLALHYLTSPPPQPISC
jgi:hypothetical protein